MKINNKQIPVLLILVMVAVLSSCGGDEVPMKWEGKWQRRVLVPANVQGRCVDETLELHNREWRLVAVIHSTFECNQPFLELVYAGVFDAVKVRRNSDDRDVRLQVADIRLVAMSDIGKSGKVALSDSMVETLSEKYVPPRYSHFEHHLLLSADGNSMQGGLYAPVQEVAIPLYPADAVPAPYQRAGQVAP